MFTTSAAPGSEWEYVFHTGEGDHLYFDFITQNKAWAGTKRFFSIPELAESLEWWRFING